MQVQQFTCGLVLDFGIVRTSTSILTPLLLSICSSSSKGRVEWPIVYSVPGMMQQQEDLTAWHWWGCVARLLLLERFGGSLSSVNRHTGKIIDQKAAARLHYLSYFRDSLETADGDKFDCSAVAVHSSALNV